MKHLRRPLSRREWLVAYAIAITGSITVAAITALLVDAGLAREANPATAWIADGSSWSIVLAFKFAVIIPAFAAYRLAADRWHPTIGRAGAWSFALVVSINVLNDAIVFFSRGPVFNLEPVLELAPVALVGVTIAAVSTLGPLDTLRRATAKTSGRQVGFAILFVVFMISAPAVPVLNLPSAVDTASATSHVIDDFEDGDTNVDKDGWTGWSSATSVTSNAISGSHSGQLSGSSGQEAYITADTAVSPTNVSLSLKLEQLSGASDDKVHFILGQTDGTANIFMYVDQGDGSLYHSTGGGYSDTGIDVTESEAFRIGYRNIDYANNQFDLYINGERVKQDFGFDTAMSSFERIRVSTESSGSYNIIFDDVTIDSDEPTDTTGPFLWDFEDGDSVAPSTMNKRQGSLDVSSYDPVNGEHSGLVSLTGTSTNDIRYSVLAGSNATLKPKRVGVRFHVRNKTDGTKSAQFGATVGSSPDWMYAVKLNHGSGTIQANTPGGWTTFTNYNPGKNQLEFFNISYSAKTYQIRYAGDEYGPFDFQSNRDYSPSFRFYNNKEQNFAFDDLEWGGPAYESPTQTTNTKTLDDFEDGDLTINDVEYWDGWTQTNSGLISVESAFDGNAANLTADSTTNPALRASQSGHSQNITAVSVDWKHPRLLNDDGNSLYIELEDSSGTLVAGAEADHRAGGVIDVATFGSSGEGEWTNDTRYTFKLLIDWQNSEYTLESTNYSTGSTTEVATTGLKSTNRIEAVDIRTQAGSGDTWTSYTDNVKLHITETTFPDPSVATGGGSGGVSGVVTDQHGQPVPDATVEVVAVDGDKITPTAGQTKADRAEELLEEASNPLPDSWNPDLDLSGSGGYFENADSEYVAIHDPEPWGLESWSSGIGDLSRVKLNPAAEEELIISVWNPAKTGVGDQLSPVNRKLPGATVNRDVVIERLDHKGDVVDSRTISLDQERSVGVPFAAYKHAYARISLPAGVYRIHPEGASNTAYTIVVGNVDDLRKSFASDLKTQANRLSTAAEDFAAKINDGTFTRKTVTTNATGHYSVDVPGSTSKVAVSAYKIDGTVLTGLSDPSPQDMRAWVKNNDYGGSVYFSVEPRKYTAPNSNADITVRKFSSPPFALLDDWVSKWDQFRSLLENGTRTDLGSLYSVNLEDWNKTQLEDGATELATLLDQAKQGNPDAISEWEDRTGLDYEEWRTDLENGDRTADQLRDELRALEQTVEGLRTQLENEEPDISYPDQPDDGPATVSYEQVFDGDFTEDDVVAVWKDFDGSSTPISDEFVSVENRIGRGDVVSIQSYPIPEGSTGGFISVTVASEDGKIGRGGGTVKNPNFDGEVPNLRSIDVSSLKPGPNEAVSIEPRVESPGVSLESVDVYDGRGNTVSSGLSNGVVNFTPGASGTHFVRMTFKDSSGNQFVETMRLPVGDSSFDYPASVAVQKGRLGTYAIAGDEVSDARVKIGASGQDLDVTALVEPESGTSEVHVYLEQAPSTPKQSITARVIEGDSIDTGTSLSHRVGLYLHGRELDDSTLVYRRGSNVEGGRQPIPANAETRGGERTQGDDGGTVIKTYTGKNGATTITTNADPSFGERLRWRFDVFVSTTDLPLTALVAPPSTVIEPASIVVEALHYVAGGVDWVVDETRARDVARAGALHGSISPVVGVEA